MASERPSFSAPLWAAARQGAKELSQVLPAFPGSVQVVEEPGAMGNPTQAMVTQQIEAGTEVRPAEERDDAAEAVQARFSQRAREQRQEDLGLEME